MSSALGKQLGLTDESTLEEIVTAIGNVIDYSNTIQTATTDTSDQTKSCYQINGSTVEVVPARGLWYNWDWGVSCIKIPISGVMNAVHGFCWNQNNSENTYTVDLVSLSTNEVFTVKSNFIVFLKSISKATLQLHVILCGGGSYWTAYLDYALNSNWKNIASNYNGDGISSGTYWRSIKNISIPLTNINVGDKIAFRSRTDKTSRRLISMTCVLDQS